MKKGSENKNRSLKDLILPFFLLVISYAILLLLPRELKWISWLILAVSAFLFCLGYFHLGNVLSEFFPEETLTPLLYLYGTGLLVSGFAYLYRTQDGARGLVVSALFLIEALTVFIIAGGNSRHEHLETIIFRTAAVLLPLFGIWLVMHDDAKGCSVETATMMLITGICLWSISGGNAYNKMNLQMKVVPGMKLSIEELYTAFRNTETPLGRAWIGNLKGIQGDCLLFGPTQDGVFVYGFYQFGSFYVAASDDEHWADPEEAEKHRLETDLRTDKSKPGLEELPEIYRSMFRTYAKMISR